MISKCNSCSGKGYRRGILVPIKYSCPICDGKGFVEHKTKSSRPTFIHLNGYGYQTMKDLSKKPHYKYNWKTGKAELIK